MFHVCSTSVLRDFGEDDLGVTKGRYYLLTSLSVGGDDRILNQKVG